MARSLPWCRWCRRCRGCRSVSAPPALSETLQQTPAKPTPKRGPRMAASNDRPVAYGSVEPPRCAVRWKQGPRSDMMAHTGVGVLPIREPIPKLMVARFPLGLEACIVPRGKDSRGRRGWRARSARWAPPVLYVAVCLTASRARNLPAQPSQGGRTPRRPHGTARGIAAGAAGRWPSPTPRFLSLDFCWARMSFEFSHDVDYGLAIPTAWGIP